MDLGLSADCETLVTTVVLLLILLLCLDVC